jgi:hypothetical protein
MSMMKAMRICARGTMTRWDFVVPTNPAAPATNGNIKRYIEVKFRGDPLTRNQRKARRRMTPDEKAKIITMKPDEDCMCTNASGLATGVAR